MENQIIDVEASSVTEEEVQEIVVDGVDSNEDKIKSPTEIAADLSKLKELNKELKKIKRYMKNPIYTIRQMDARTELNS